MKLSKITEEIKCSSIDDLIKNLERASVRMLTSEGGRVVHGSDHASEPELQGHYFWRGQSFVFRGMANSEWSLISSLFRNLKEADFEYRIAQLVGLNSHKGNFSIRAFSSWNGNIDEDTYKVFAAIITEFYFLDAFYRSANINGLRVPPIRQLDECFSSSEYSMGGWETEIIREYMQYKEEHFGKNSSAFMQYETLAALAQHYGVTTRLLDWSYDMIVALYFAVMGAAKSIVDGEMTHDGSCAVWIMDVENLVMNTFRKLRVVTPPYFDNANLAAQKGVLSYWQTAELTDYLLPLDEQIVKYFSSRADCMGLLNQKYFYKLTLPYTEIKHAIEYLIVKGYTAARLFPGYQGVVRSFEEHRLFQLLTEPELVKKHLSNFREKGM